MVAYSFQQRFEAPILSGRKRGTIRNVGKRRHVNAGEEIHLYVGMRTRHCRLIARATCEAVFPIRLTFSTPEVWIGSEVHGKSIGDLDGFAQGDGFDHWDDMAAFWRKTHHCLNLPPWTGLWILWDLESLVTP